MSNRKLTRSTLRQIILETINEESAAASQRDIGELSNKIQDLMRRVEAIEATLTRDLDVDQVRSMRDRLKLR